MKNRLKSVPGVFLILFLLLSATGLNGYSQTVINSEILEPSNLYQGTNGLVYSDWDRIYFPSYSNNIKRNFIYVPLSASDIFNTDHFTAGSSFILGPFRFFLMGDLYISTDKYQNENESYSYQDTLYQDSDGDGVNDVYRYTYSNTYKYDKNFYNRTSLFMSPGVSLTIGPLTGGARYIFKMFNYGNINFDYSYKSVTTDASYTSNNTSTTNDIQASLRIKNSGMINGFAAGASIDLNFVRIQGDLFSTIQNIGGYSLSTTENTYNLDANGLPINGTNVDYIVQTTSHKVTNGWLNFAGLSNTSAIFTENSSNRFEYVPNDPSGIFSASYPFTGASTIHMPQIVTDIYLLAEGELFNFVVPLYLKYRASSLTQDSFVHTSETTQYASQDVESQHDKTTTTLSLKSKGSNEVIAGTGIIKRFTMDRLSFQIGAKYYINPIKYNIKITQKVEAIHQIDGTGNGSYNDAGDTNTTTVSNGYYKMYDYSSLLNYFVFPVSFIFNITSNFQFFGGAEFSYWFGNEKSGYLDTGGYNSVVTTDNITSTDTVTTDNYATEPVMQYTKTSVSSASIAYSFGFMYYFNKNLIFITELLSVEPTIDSATGPDLFNMKLIAEIDYRFGRQR